MQQRDKKSHATTTTKTKRIKGPEYHQKNTSQKRRSWKVNINRNNHSVPVHPPNLPFHPSDIHISSHPSVLSLSLSSLYLSSPNYNPNLLYKKPTTQTTPPNQHLSLWKRKEERCVYNICSKGPRKKEGYIKDIQIPPGNEQVITNNKDWTSSTNRKKQNMRRNEENFLDPLEHMCI